MRQRIGSRLYDTTTARKVAEYETPQYRRGDFRWHRETLYKKRSGEIYLYGEGGPLTCYAERGSDGLLGCGSAIVPMSAETAIEWQADWERELDLMWGRELNA